MKLTSLLTAITASLLLAACGGSKGTDKIETPDNKLEAPATESVAAGAQATCVKAFQRSRTCTDDYIPMLVDVRIELDNPAGIAQAAQTEGRDALIAAAMQEWQNDSTDEAITRHCQNMVDKAPADVIAQLMPAQTACMAKDSCSEYAACVKPIHKQLLQPQAAQAPAQ